MVEERNRGAFGGSTRALGPAVTARPQGTVGPNVGLTHDNETMVVGTDDVLRGKEGVAIRRDRVWASG